MSKIHPFLWQPSKVSLRAVLLCLLIGGVGSLKHTFHFRGGGSLIGPVGLPFGFLDSGSYELNVKFFNLSTPLEHADAAFFLQRFDNEAAFHHYMEVLQNNRSRCSFEYFQDTHDDVIPADDDGKYDHVGVVESAAHGIILTMQKHSHTVKKTAQDVHYNFHKGEAGLYFLIYQVCPFDRNTRSSFDIDYHFLNYDSMGNPNYLTAGEMKLPTIFFFFSISYLCLLVIWVLNNHKLHRSQPGLFGDHHAPVYAIHHLMSALLMFKFLATFLEAIRYHVIKVSGHAELWSVAFYVTSFIKGTFLFLVLALIGTGWSFVKPVLQKRERRIVYAILIFQVLNNLALTVLSQINAGEASYERWTAILHLVDILCCCAVLVPIVWQVNALEKSVNEREEGEPEGDDDAGNNKGEILRKLRLFRTFYLIVIAYIYATRILIYLFEKNLTYQYLWVAQFVVEVVTLTFYVAVGMLFRPMSQNPYSSLKREENDEVELASRQND